MTKGHYGPRHKLYKRARESLIKALSYSYAHRKERKGDMRRLWILRINAAAHAEGISYSRLMNSLKQRKNDINRKMLADLALRDPQAFAQVVADAKAT